MPLSVERVRGTIDLPLTPEGRREISLWAQWFKARGGVDLVYHSSLVRDHDTAALLAKPSRALMIDLGEALFPQDQGVLSGMEKSAAVDRQGRFLADPSSSPRGGESLTSAASRFLPIWWDILKMSKHQKVILVTHGSNIQLSNAWTSAGAKRSLELNSSAMGLKVCPDDVFYVNPMDFLDLPPIQLTRASLAPLAFGLYQVRHGRTAWSG